jgi:hypothetical protein
MKYSFSKKYNKMKKKKYHIVGTKSNINTVERDNIDTIKSPFTPSNF